MVERRVVVFETDSHEADERFIREYVVPKYERLTSIDGCTGLRFSRYAADPRKDHGEIHLVLFGDHDAVVERERDRWDEFVEDGLVREWRRTGLSWESWPDDQFEFMKRMQTLATGMAVVYYRNFDSHERPAPADAFPETDRRLGFWVAVHFLCNQMGYQSVQDEIDASFGSIRNRLRALQELRSEAVASERIEELRKRLDEVEAEL